MAFLRSMRSSTASITKSAAGDGLVGGGVGHEPGEEGGLARLHPALLDPLVELALDVLAGADEHVLVDVLHHERDLVALQVQRPDLRTHEPGADDGDLADRRPATSGFHGCFLMRRWVRSNA
jgi:hypothetical protein